MAKNIQPAFWLANAQEAMERLAYFGIRAVLPLMMVSAGTGGLGLSMFEKGIIYTVWALIQCLIPMVSGGFSESFGYKKSLIVAFTINAIGYVLMANILNLSALIT
ncbi:MAG: MFS transporter, partial [Proteobacteria bacterium]|nr:MFS transporter [Pseudomonadota bacterium]